MFTWSVKRAAAWLPMGKKGKKSAAARGEPVDASPVNIETIKPGDDTIFPTEGDMLTVHYTGSLRDDGSEFDSSRAKKQPFTFTLGKGEVIRGWELGLVQMSLGQRAKLTIAPEAGYGEKGCVDQQNASGTGVIPPNATLLFDVELLDINSQRSLGRYLTTLDDWIQAKLLAFDVHEGVRERMTEKYGSRDAYASHLRMVAGTKYDAERVKKNAPRAPTIEELTAALVAASASLRAAAQEKPAAKQTASAAKEPDAHADQPAAATAAQEEPAAQEPGTAAPDSADPAAEVNID